MGGNQVNLLCKRLYIVYLFLFSASFYLYQSSQTPLKPELNRGLRYLTGDNLKVLRVEFSTISRTVLPNNNIGCKTYTQTLLELKTRPRLAEVFPEACTIKLFRAVTVAAS